MYLQQRRRLFVALKTKVAAYIADYCYASHAAWSTCGEPCKTYTKRSRCPFVGADSHGPANAIRLLDARCMLAPPGEYD